VQVIQLEFHHDLEYWALLRAMRLSARGDYCQHEAVCSMHASSLVVAATATSGSAASGSSSSSSSVGGATGGGAGPSGRVRVKFIFDGHLIKIKNITSTLGRFTTRYAKGTPGADDYLDLDSRDIKAIAISRDYNAPAAFSLAVNFSHLESDMFPTANTDGPASGLSVAATVTLASGLLASVSGVPLSRTHVSGLADVFTSLTSAPTGTTSTSSSSSMDMLNAPLEVTVSVNGVRRVKPQRGGRDVIHNIPLGTGSITTSASCMLEGIDNENKREGGNVEGEGQNAIRIAVPLEVPESHRAARVVLESAIGLCPTYSDRDPSPYAVVYLLDAQGNKLSAKNSEDAQTKVASSTCDPEFNDEFILYGPRGLEDVVAVRVKIKDGGSNKLLASDLNLGQLDIPISCFVEKVPCPEP